MTDSENSVVQNESDEDIYKDFSEFNFEQELVKIETSREQYKEEVNNLSEKVKEIREENKKLQHLNNVLEKNLSTLLKTAQAEIKRKDSLIEELQEKIDSFKFRRKNKITKDKYTNTEISESATDDVSNAITCKCQNIVKESQSERHHSREKSRENKYKSSKNENKSEIKSLRHGSSECDAERRKSYSRETEKINFRCSEGKYEAPYDKHKGSSTLIYKGHDQKPYRKSHRDYTNKFSEDGRRSRRSNNSCYSSVESESVRRASSGKSPERRSRKDLIRSRSKSRSRSRSRSQYREYSKSNKEHALENHSSVRSSLKSDSKSRAKEKTAVKENGLDKSKNRYDKSHDKRHKSNEKKKHSRMSEMHSTDSSRKEKEAVDSFKRVSVLDSLYEDIVSRRSVKEILKPSTCSVEAKSNLEEGECDDHELSNPAIIQEGEDWALSFKNERQDNIKPVTLYSKRMMKKLGMKSAEENNKSLANNKKDDNTTTLMEKEPGELTDDESVIENSKEFREVAQTAMTKSNVDSKVLSSQRNDISNSVTLLEDLPREGVPVKTETVNGPSTTVGVKLPTTDSGVENSKSSELNLGSDKENLLLDKKKECCKEVIEFSPFKNNYKLIEISPIKPHEKLGKDSKFLRVEQREVETSIFTLLSNLSGVPIESDLISKKTTATAVADDKHKVTTDPVQSECNSLEKIDDESGNGSEQKEAIGPSQNEEIKVKKSITLQSYKKKKQLEKEAGEKQILQQEKTNANSEATADDGNVTEESSLGETTQFLNFFLLTTSPSKPILPAEEEKSIKHQPKSPPRELTKNELPTSALCESNEPVEMTATCKSSNENTEKNEESYSKESSIIQESDQVRDKTETYECEPKNNKIRTSKMRSEAKTKETVMGDASAADRKRRKTSENEKEEEQKGEQKNSRKRKISNHEDQVAQPKLLKMSESKPNEENHWDEGDKAEKRDENAGEGAKSKEDISFFEFFKPTTKKGLNEQFGKGDLSNSTDIRMTTTMSLTGVVRLQTPNKCVEKLKNLMINEQTIYHVVDTTTNGPFSPVVGAKFVEMTPRRMLKSDLMLTDSEDDFAGKVFHGTFSRDIDGNVELSQSENSGCESDSGASDFVDLL